MARTGVRKDGATQLGKYLKKLDLNCKYGNFPMAPRMHDLETRRNLTSNYVSILSYHPVTTRQNCEHGVQLCLGESPEFKCFDLCYTRQHGTTGITRRKYSAPLRTPGCLMKGIMELNSLYVRALH